VDETRSADRPPPAAADDTPPKVARDIGAIATHAAPAEGREPLQSRMRYFGNSTP